MRNQRENEKENKQVGSGKRGLRMLALKQFLGKLIG